MHRIWNGKGMFQITEQRLLDQKAQIIRKKWLTELELEEIKRMVEHEESEAVGDVTSEDKSEYNEQELEINGNENDLNVNDRVSLGQFIVDRDQNNLNENEKIILQQLNEIKERERKRLPALRGVERRRLIDIVNRVDVVLGKVKVADITELNDLIYCGAALVTEIIGVKSKATERKEPYWKRRLENQLNVLNKDLSRINLLIEGRSLKKKHADILQKRYKMKQKGLRTTKEIICQRIKAKAAKIKRYNQRISQFQQNRLFTNNERRFYQLLNNDLRLEESEAPDPEEAKKFWSDIWSIEGEHRKDTEWLKEFCEEVGASEAQEDISITENTVKRILRKFPNWKAPGPDGVQGFWLKKFKSIHSLLALTLSKCLEEGKTPLWMTKGRTLLIQKDRSKGTIASNNRPITCLPLAWKLLTGIFYDEIYRHLEGQDLLPEEQKGCRRKSKGTGDLLFIDRMILKEVKSRKKHLSMAWIDYRKAYDLIPHSWLMECLAALKVSQNVQKLLKETMNLWRVEMTCRNEVIGEVRIR